MHRIASSIILLIAASLTASGCRDSALDHYNLGIDALEHGDTTAALSHFEQSVAERPSDPDARVNLGVALLGAGQPERALQEFQRAAQQIPNDVALHVNIAEAYKALGRSQPARTEYEYALGQDPDMVEALTGYGELLVGAGQYEAATAQLLKAISLKPSYAPAQFHLGWLYIRTGRPVEGTHYFVRGLRADPASEYGRIGLAESYLARDMPADAILEFQKVYAADSTSVPAMVGIGDCQVRMEDYVHADRMLEKALRHAPHDARANKCMADGYAARGRNADAAALYREAIQQRADYADAYLGLGNVLAADGDVTEAEVALKGALLHSPHNPDVLYHLGLVYTKMENTGLARSYLEMALDAAGSDGALRARIRSALDSIPK